MSMFVGIWFKKTVIAFLRERDLSQSILLLACLCVVLLIILSIDKTVPNGTSAMLYDLNSPRLAYTQQYNL